MVAMNPPPATSVYLNHTLALVAGAPQSALRSASTASGVAWVVFWVRVVGSEPMTVARETASLDGVAALAAETATAGMSATAMTADRAVRDNIFMDESPFVYACRPIGRWLNLAHGFDATYDPNGALRAVRSDYCGPCYS